MKIREPVERKNWPCGIMADEGNICAHMLVSSEHGEDLGESTGLSHLIEESILKIKTARTTHLGYEIMYMADSGNNLLNSNKIYFTLCLYLTRIFTLSYF